jgi:hypothetical protein
MSFISCNEHKEDSIYKFNAEFKVFKIFEK